MRKKNRTVPYKKTLVIGFVVFYLISRLLSTYLMKCMYDEVYNNKMYELRDEFYLQLAEADEILAEKTEAGRRMLSGYANILLSNIYPEDEYQQIMAVLYDMDGQLIAKTGNVFGNVVLNMDKDRSYSNYYLLEDYLTEEEIYEISRYFDYEALAKQWEDSGEMDYVTYVGKMQYDEKADELLALYVVEHRKEYTPPDGWSVQTTYTPVWEWKNPQMLEQGKSISYDEKTAITINYRFPYLNNGTKQWEKWQEDEWLQGLLEYDIKKKSESKKGEQGGLMREISMDVAAAKENSGLCRLILRQTAHSWLAAMDYMKYIYLLGAVITLICMMIVRKSLEKTYMERVKYENLRLIFTNKAVNELKEPLRIMKMQMKELQDGMEPTQKEAALNQIIGHTEKMDHLVRKMILVSKLEEEDLEQYQGLR